MRFELNYRIGDGDIKSLGAWLEASEGLARRVVIDLSSLKGKDVIFFLRAEAAGSATDDSGLWIRPRIVRD